MQSKDWFIVGARLFGLWTLYNGVLYITTYAELRLGITELHQPLAISLRATDGGTYLVHAFLELGFAWVLLLRTEALTQYVFHIRNAEEPLINERMTGEANEPKE